MPSKNIVLWCFAGNKASVYIEASLSRAWHGSYRQQKWPSISEEIINFWKLTEVGANNLSHSCANHLPVKSFRSRNKQNQNLNQIEKQQQQNKNNETLVFYNHPEITLLILTVVKISRLLKALYHYGTKSIEQWIKLMPKKLEVEKAQFDSHPSLLNFREYRFLLSFCFLPQWLLLPSLCWLFLISPSSSCQRSSVLGPLLLFSVLTP